MPEAATAPAPVTPTPPPTKIPPPVAAGSQGAGALADDKTKPADNPFEFELDVKGQKQKMTFASKAQLTAALQKALYADQTIKDGIQAKKGAEAMMTKLKAIAAGDVEAFEQLLSDPEIKGDARQIALAMVQRMMAEEEKYKGWSPEQIEAAKAVKERDQLLAEKKQREQDEINRKEKEKRDAQAVLLRGEIIEAMKKFPDIPQTQATMDAVILNMRAAFRRFGRHITPEQAMTVYNEQYWGSLLRTIEKMTPEQLVARFGDKALDKIQQLKLNELKKRTNPAAAPKPANGTQPDKKKKNLTEKEFDAHFKELAGL